MENMNQNNNDYRKIPTISPNKAAILGLITVFIIFQFGGGLLTLGIFGLDFQNADMNLMRLLTIASQMLFIFLPAVWFSKLVFVEVTPVIRARSPKPKEVGLFVVGMVLLIPLLQDYLYLQNIAISNLAEVSSTVNSIKSYLDMIDKMVEESYLQLLTANNILDYITVIAAVSITPAICEEFFFRGFVQKSFEYKQKPFTAILLTSLFFGLYHFNPYGLIPLIAIGFYLGYSVYRSDSIVVPIILHFLNNFVSIIAFFIYGKEELMQTNFDMGNINLTVTRFIIIFALFVAFIIFMERTYQNQKSEAENDLS